MLSALMIFGVLAGAFPYVNNIAVAHAEAISTYATDDNVGEIYSDEAPSDLKALQAASDGQLAHWADVLTQFDGRDYDYITSDKSQGNKNICWAYAAIGVAEANILRKGIDPSVNKNTLDLDEEQLAWARDNRDGSVDPLGNTVDDTSSHPNWDKGGFPMDAFAVMSQDYAPLSQGAPKAFAKSKYRAENIIRLPNDVDAIKEALIKYGAVDFSYRAPESYVNYHISKGDHNHESVIVGWDDTISKDEFEGQATRNGAWIVKNSWTHHGIEKNGTYCFYLSYDSVIGLLHTADFALTSDHENYYYYDGLIGDGTSFPGNLQGDFAAIYQAKKSSATEKEILDAVYVGISGKNVTCTVEVYTGLTVQAGDVNSSVNIPTQGAPKSTQTAFFANPIATGHYTVKLDNPVELNVGEWFSIVVHLTNEAGDARIMLGTDSSMNDMTYYRQKDVWKSFKYESTSYPYADAKSHQVARIRAFTRTEARTQTLAKTMNNALIIIQDRFTYYRNGSQFRPEVKVYFGDDKLIEGTDYKLQYVNNVAPNTTDDPNNDAKVVVTGIGDYSGTRTESIFVGKDYLPSNKPTYQLDVYDDVTTIRDIELPEGWEWSAYNPDLDIPLQVGVQKTAYITYVGTNYYRYITGTLYVTKQVQTSQTSISGCTVEIADYDYFYSGTAITPPVTVTLNGQTLNFFTDYKVTYSNNTESGTATITVTGVGKYSGTATKTFEIKAVEVNTDPIPEPEHKHELTLVPRTEATCTTNGNKAYYTCNDCGKWFEDDKGETEITDQSTVIIPAAHDYTGVDWNSSADGHWKVCAVCNEPTEKTVHDSNGANGACSVCGYKASALEPEPNPEPDEENNSEENNPNDGDEPTDEDDHTAAVAVGVTTGVIGAGAVCGIASWFVRRRRRL